MKCQTLLLKKKKKNRMTSTAGVLRVKQISFAQLKERFQKFA